MKTRSALSALFLCVTLAAALLSGCATTPNTPASPSPSPVVSPSPTPSPSMSPEASQSSADTVSSASLVNTADGFEKAISENGTWIICLLSDITIDKALVVDGDFMNDKTPPASQRKLAFYAQDENRTVTDRYTLTAPSMTINSIDCAIWKGTFRGDLYVAAKNFQLIGATVDGNVYFTNADAQSTFKMDENSQITGMQQLQS